MASDACPLSTAADNILQAALGLSESERATVAAKIIESLDPDLDDGYTDEEWSAEIARRVEASKAGTVETIPWEQARRRIQEAGERGLGR
jgi:putative addiction module component (TIGR02574 family)